MIEPRLQDVVERRRHDSDVGPVRCDAPEPARPASRDHFVLREHLDEFLDEERVAVGAVGDEADELVGHDVSSLEDLTHELLGRRGSERAQVDPTAGRRGEPARVAFDQVGTGERDDHQPGVGEAVDQVGDCLERLGVGPVEVLEQEHGRRVGHQPASQRCSRHTRILRALRCRTGRAHRDRSPTSGRRYRPPSASTRPRSRIAAWPPPHPGRRCPAPRNGGRTRHEPGRGCSFEARQGATLEQPHRLGAQLEPTLQLEQQPRLAHAGITHHDDTASATAATRCRTAVQADQLDVTTDRGRLDAFDATTRDAERPGLARCTT